MSFVYFIRIIARKMDPYRMTKTEKNIQKQEVRGKKLISKWAY